MLADLTLVSLLFLAISISIFNIIFTLVKLIACRKLSILAPITVICKWLHKSYALIAVIYLYSVVVCVNYAIVCCFSANSHFDSAQYQSSVKHCTPIGTIVLEASAIIDASDTINYVEFGIVNGSINTGDFLINGTVPPVILPPPFRSSYLLLIVTGNQVDAINRTNITFDLYSMINTTSGMAMPRATVVLQLPGTVNSSNVLCMLSQLPKILNLKCDRLCEKGSYSFSKLSTLVNHISSGF